MIPGKVLLFAAPDGELPTGRLWFDYSDRRRFGAAFYTDLFRDKGVELVMRLDRTGYDDSPFLAAGIDVCSLEDLGCQGDDDGLSLQVLSRRRPSSISK